MLRRKTEGPSRLSYGPKVVVELLNNQSASRHKRHNVPAVPQYSRHIRHTHPIGVCLLCFERGVPVPMG
jgi:hypothetical protein